MDNERNTGEATSDIIVNIDNIASQLKYGFDWNDTIDYLKACIEKTFKVDIDEFDLDNIERDINALEDSEEKEDCIELYDLIRDRLVNVYNTYYGVSFDDEPDLNQLYSVYNTLVVNLVDTIAKCTASELHKEGKSSVDITYLDIERVIGDASLFNLDTIPELLDEIDTGNVMYQYVFGNPTSSLTPDESGKYDVDGTGYECKVNIEWDAFITKINKYLDFDGSPLNKDALYKRTCYLMDKCYNLS